MATTKLYSWPAKFRMALDLVLPKKKLTPGERNDESLESFVVRRMGRESLDRLAEPLVGGVNGSDPKDMSLAATYPMLLDMEQQYGSLVRGFLAQRKRVEEMKAKYPPKPGAKPRTFFSSFHEGLQFLTDRMADAAGRDNIITGVAATAISREADGCWRVTLGNGEVLVGDAVIVAAEAWATAPLLEGVDSHIAELVASIPCSSSATILMGLDEADCPFDKQWHGILSPAVEQEPVTGISLMSSKWPDRAPAGRVLLRGFVGGPRDQAIIKRSDEELIEIARSSFVRLLGVKADAKPVFARVFRWVGGMPQYTMGHLDRVDAIEARTAEISGLALAGGAYRGVGVPNCLESGEKAVTKVLADWGITMAEDSQPTQPGLPRS
jgi:oxygen-dependent protoporphyrinogen oxidase